MPDNSHLEWETIESKSSDWSIPGSPVMNSRYDRVERCKVVGGWLVRSFNSDFSQSSSSTGGDIGIGLGVGLTFVPDPNYEWVV